MYPGWVMGDWVGGQWAVDSGQCAVGQRVSTIAVRRWIKHPADETRVRPDPWAFPARSLLQRSLKLGQFISLPV